MITGMHALLYSRHAEEVQRFLRDVLELSSVDAGDPGEAWPIFAAPPVEIAVHPTEDEPRHELYLMCDDIKTTVEKLSARGISTSPIADRGWGLVTSVTLPGGEAIGMYEPRHPSPLKK